ncbi:MAG: PspC domain-containing protein [Flavobacteriales bacterium]
MINRLRHIYEKNAFGVCARIAERFSLNVSDLRLGFIYFSFLTFGSPLIIYLFMMMMLKLKDNLTYKRKRAFEL